MVTEFTQQVLTLIKQIPAGKVATYGLIAKLAGSPRGARQVSWILHSMTGKHKLPWHRVISSQGRISIMDDEGKDIQTMLLIEEGVEISSDHKIDLKKYLWNAIPNKT